MTVFDSLFFNIFNYYKHRKNKKANSIAVYYISFLHCSLLLFTGVCIGLFLDKMNTNTMSSDKAWTLFTITCIIIYFKNWIQYSGKKRKVLNAKSLNKRTKPTYPILLLWLLPIGTLSVSIILIYLN